MQTMKNTVLSTLRRVSAALVLLGATLIFLDFTGLFQGWLGFIAKIQFLPAVLAANFVVIAALLLLTLLFGRIYCSVICPLGIFQDGISWLSGLRSKGRKRLRFGYSPEKKWLRYTLFGLFVLALIFGVQAFVALLAPYSAYGRIVTNLFQPIYRFGNNLLASLSEHFDNYAFYPKEVWLKSLPTFIVAAVTLVAVAVLAWKHGRTYCNTICPVGTALSFVSRFAMFRPTIDASKCRNCKLCERSCKASCIDLTNHRIDGSRCVDCFNCIDACKFDSLHYKFAWGAKAGLGGKAEAAAESSGAKAENGPVAEKLKTAEPADKGRRAFISSALMLAGAVGIEAQEKKLDGGLATLIAKKEPERSGRLVPFGAVSPEHFYSHCTACGLCIAACPNQILRPSDDLEHLMMPYMSYEKGYCRPECTKCSQVCPTGAILPITPEEKTAISIGIASVDYDLCVVNTDGVNCGNCARHCPVFAIHMVAKDKSDNNSLRIPAVDSSKCIGCGACENLCPASPYSAIRVNGRDMHSDKR